jgi:hypothetical protein
LYFFLDRHQEIVEVIEVDHEKVIQKAGKCHLSDHVAAKMNNFFYILDHRLKNEEIIEEERVEVIQEAGKLIYNG